MTCGVSLRHRRLRFSRSRSWLALAWPLQIDATCIRPGLLTGHLVGSVLVMQFVRLLGYAPDGGVPQRESFGGAAVGSTSMLVVFP